MDIENMTAEEVAAKLEQVNVRLAKLNERRTAIENMLADPEAQLTHEDGTEATTDEIAAEAENIDAEIDTEERNKRSLISATNARRSAARRAQIAANGTQQRSAAIVTHNTPDFATTKRTSTSAHETRSMLLSSSGFATPTSVSGINDPFNIVSSIVDEVTIEDLTGMGSMKEAYIKSWQTASAKTDGTAQSGSDPAFRTALIAPALLGVLTYISREYAKQSPLDYEAKVKEGAMIALKKKLANWLITGTGSSQPFGIYNAANTESTPETIYDTYALTGNIGADTLRKIVLNYGGDENVMGGCRLYLNKADLIAFGDVRGTNEKKAVYEITPDGNNPNTGIIQDGGLAVPYTICSDVTSYSGATATSTGVKTMIYGDPKAYKLGLFGNFEVRVSEDYKFAEGLNAVMGEVMVGGNIVKDKGFTVILKKTA